MKCPFINPSVSQCLNCDLDGCDGGESKSTAEKQKRHYHRNISKMRMYHRNYQQVCYDKAKNTEKCRKHREKYPDKKKIYDHERYERLKRERQAG
jgi:hypothetical protein